MAKRPVVSLMAVLILVSGFAAWMAAQDRDVDNGNSVIRVTVAMVQLNVAVTDSKGNYVTGLRPSDFVMSEDGIGQNLATFEEGNEGPRNVLDAPQAANAPKAPIPSSAPPSQAQRPNDSPRGGAPIEYARGNCIRIERRERFRVI